MPGSLAWLALGAFAIGTEGYMIAGLLPVIAGSLDISVAAAGQLITIFAAAYAIGTPILAALLADINRRRLLTGALAAFAAANLFAAAAHNFGQLAAARMVLALAAGAFLPAASAVAAAIVPIRKRGRAIAVITGGGTVAVALGAPLGTWIASLGDWRTTFLLIGALSALATLGLFLGLPRDLPLSPTRLRERFDTLRQPGIPAALGISTLWAAGGFCFYSYVSPFLIHTLALSPTAIAAILGLTGAAAGIGTALGGLATDRHGPMRVRFACAIALIVILASLSLAANTLPPAIACSVITILIALWACAGWAFGPAHQTQLTQIAPHLAAVTLSLHASAVYAGIALGTMLGALTIETIGVAGVGYVGALCQLAGLALLALTAGRVEQISANGLTAREEAA